ncbi:MAG: hypothetical protein ABIV25_02525 [Paracoccaceae bacterium]
MALLLAGMSAGEGTANFQNDVLDAAGFDGCQVLPRGPTRLVEVNG